MVVYVIHEENHGILGVAATREAAIQWLIRSEWMRGSNEIWIPEIKDTKFIGELYPDWEKWLMKEATPDDFENMGFWIIEENLIE